MVARSTSKAFAVSFRELDRWDVGFFGQVSWKWPLDTLKPLSTALERVVRKIPRKEYQKGLRIIEKITFGGELVSFELDDETEYKGRLFDACAGELVYSKIRLKQGSVATVPARLKHLAVSAEYPVYRVKGDQALSDYVLLVLRSRAFQNLLVGLSHGGSTKTRIHAHLFERLVIPLPDLTIQRAIVTCWRKAASAVEDARRQLAAPVRVLNRRLVELYRRESVQDVIRSRFFALDFESLAEWDVKSGRAAAFRFMCPSFRPMGDFIEDATEAVRPFDEPEKNWPVYGVNNRDGVFLNGHQSGHDFHAPYKRIRKDWFFHNPTRCSVGSLGIVPDVPEDAITSPEYQVWRVKENKKGMLHMLPRFIAVLIQTPFFIDLVQFNRVGAVKQRMYTDNLCQMRIPYLQVSEQEKYAQARQEALIAFSVAREQLARAREDVEGMIVGLNKASTDTC